MRCKPDDDGPRGRWSEAPKGLRTTAQVACSARVCATGILTALHLLVALAATAQAPETQDDDFGTLNPPDTGREMLRRKLEMGAIDPVTCSLGFNTAKYDDHELARQFATRCAEAGITKAMTWMSQMETNGLGGPVNAEAAAGWDRRAADAGDPVGMYNYGLDLLRGYGVVENEALGRHYVDRAAQLGLAIAQRLRDADYDLEEVTPDIEDW